MTTPSIHPDTTLGYVHLTVSNLEQSVAYYEQALGFRLHRQQDTAAYLGAGQADLLRLTENPKAITAKGVTGLYHFAILHPSRLELAHALQRLVDTQTPVGGFSDHLVSEAIYLSDPDGIGIELYRDRPRTEWQYPNNQLKMTVDPLDIDGLLAELHGAETAWPGLSAQTVIGHIHLHVANIAPAESFYRDVMGFDLMLRYGSSASFMSAGGYHHHLGMNTWAGVGAPPPLENSAGLRWYTIELPNPATLEEVLDRVRQANIPVQQQPEGYFLQDPSHNGIILTSTA